MDSTLTNQIQPTEHTYYDVSKIIKKPTLILEDKKITGNDVKVDHIPSSRQPQSLIQPSKIMKLKPPSESDQPKPKKKITKKKNNIAETSKPKNNIMKYFKTENNTKNNRSTITSANNMNNNNDSQTHVPTGDQISTSVVSTSEHSAAGAGSQSMSRQEKLLEIQDANYQPDLAENESSYSNLDFIFPN